MLNSLTSGLQSAFKLISGSSRLTENNIDEAISKVRLALLEADVNIVVVRDFLEQVKKLSLGTKVIGALNPTQSFISIVQQEMVKILGFKVAEVSFGSMPTVFMLFGLQGVGKNHYCC